ncbi:MAG: squalene/phytoene synthase family protein, partial [Polyangia bacterium]
EQVKTAYLVARAADTIADTRLLPAARRLQLLDVLKAALFADADRHGIRHEIEALLPVLGDRALGSDAERELLQRIAEVLEVLVGFQDADRQRAEKVLATLITGMERDLQRFPNAQPGEPAPVPVALDTLSDLDEHTYYAAGCVGEYWTLMCAAHVPGLERLARPDFVARGVRLGKALQLVNVLRDIPADLAEGRCYLPAAMLDEVHVRPSDLVALGDPSSVALRRRAAPVIEALRQRALEHVDAAFPYVLAIPASQPRLRLAALWPLWIGLGTLEKIRDAADPLDPSTTIKISRNEVYALMAESIVVVGFDGWLAARHQARRRRAA